MGKMIRSLALEVPLRFFCATSQKNYIKFPFILDTHFVYHILCDLIFLNGRVFMTNGTKSVIHERRDLLKVYAYDAFLGLGIFVIFAFTSIVVEYIATVIGQFGILFGIVLRIVGWSISIIGAICGISLAIRNAYDFLKLLIKGSPKEKSGSKGASEGRVE